VGGTTCPTTQSWCQEYGFEAFGNRWVRFSNRKLHLGSEDLRHMATPTSAAAFNGSTNRLTGSGITGDNASPSLRSNTDNAIAARSVDLPISHRRETLWVRVFLGSGGLPEDRRERLSLPGRARLLLPGQAACLPHLHRQDGLCHWSTDRIVCATVSAGRRLEVTPSGARRAGLGLVTGRDLEKVSSGPAGSVLPSLFARLPPGLPDGHRFARSLPGFAQLLPGLCPIATELYPITTEPGPIAAELDARPLPGPMTTGLWPADPRVGPNNSTSGPLSGFARWLHHGVQRPCFGIDSSR